MPTSAEIKPSAAPDLHRSGARTPELEAAFLDLAGAARLQAEWRGLLAGAADPNPFLGPDFFLPLVEKVAGDRLTGVMALRRPELGTSALAALFPYRLASRFPLTSLPVVEAFTHPFVSDATPLISAEDLGETAEAFLAALRERFPGHMLVLESVRLDGATFAALDRAAAAQALPLRLVQSHERAGLRAGLPSERYLRERVAGKKLRELRRCEKRLREGGQVALRTLSGPDTAHGLREFLRLEASGWKGRRGTALASAPRVRAFAEAALAGGSAPETVIDLLEVDGTAIAAAVHLVAGGKAVAFKCAYDESWARMSPGAVLDLHSLRVALDERRFALMDSCAVPGHPVEALWCDRIRVGKVAIGLGRSCGAPALEGFARRRQALQAWKADAKALVGRLHRIGSELQSGRYFGRR